MAIYDRICRTCGASFRGGPRAWYCPDCQEAMHRKIDSEQGTAYYHSKVDKAERSAKRRKHYAEHKDEINRKRREKYAKKNKTD